MKQRTVPNLRDVSDGLKLALRGRVQLRQDLIDFENPKETIKRVDELSEDLVRNGLTDLSAEISYDWKRDDVVREIESMLMLPLPQWGDYMRRSSLLQERLAEVEKMGKEIYALEESTPEEESLFKEIDRNKGVRDEYLQTAAEFFVNVCMSKRWVYPQERDDLYIPREISWAQKGAWR